MAAKRIRSAPVQKAGLHDGVSGFPGAENDNNPAVRTGKGRDLFDVSFLRGLAQPDYNYIEKVLGLGEQEFQRRFDARVRELDLEFLARDVEPFLFSQDQKERMQHFHE